MADPMTTNNFKGSRGFQGPPPSFYRSPRPPPPNRRPRPRAEQQPASEIVTVTAPVVPVELAPHPVEPAHPAHASHAPEPQDARREQPDQRMRRVLARDHSFCYRCARTGHYTKDCMWFKTQLCKYWQEGNCRHGFRNGENVCMYAHGQNELRPITPAWCIRVVHDNGNMLVFGCGAPFHTPETCPRVTGVTAPPPAAPQAPQPPQV